MGKRGTKRWRDGEGSRRNWGKEEVGEESGRDTELERCRELERLILVKEAENLKVLVGVRGKSKRHLSYT